MKVRLSLLALFLAGVAPALAAGCGGDDNETTTAPAGGATGTDAQTVNVSETEYRLDPSNPTVQPGTVTFEVTNDGGVDHNLEVEGPGGEQELEQDIGPRESGTLTVDLSTPGRYEFYCPVGDHRDRGMEGEITVAGEGGASAGGAGTGSEGSTGGGGGSGYGY
jgi:plastocyanin